MRVSLTIGCLLAFSGIAQSKLQINTTSLPVGFTGVAYNQTLSATGGPPPFTWSLISGTLPSGLSITTGGVIAGTPKAVASSTFTVQAQDANGDLASQSLTINVDPAVMIATSSLPEAFNGAAYSQTLTASGGTPPDQWTVISGSLPAGISLSAGGSLSGTPLAVGSFSFSVQVEDSNGSTATQPLTLTVAQPVSITTGSLPGGTPGQAYSQTLSAFGGSGTYTWSVSSGALPAGLTLSSGGAISGTPSALGTSNFTVQVTDSSGNKATKALSIVIAAALTITTASLPGGTAGTLYQQALAASGGTGGYSWVVTAGSLPASLSLSAGGSITGTPSAPVTSNFTVQVTDSSGTHATKTLSIVIAPAPLVITTSSLPNGTVGAAYAQTLAASGGTGGYNWIVTAGALPANLSLSAAGSITGTPSAPGTSNFTVQVTDSSGTHATRALSILIAPASLTITTSSLPGGTAGAAYAQTLTASGGTGGYSWIATAGSLPASLSLSAAGSITGTPSAPGTSNFTVQVTDSSGTQASKALSIVIAPASLTITTSSLASGTVGAAYAQTLAASGGTGGYSWIVTAGALPASLSLSAGGSITGTPSAPGTSNFTVQVTDSSGTQASKALSIVIAPASLTITTSSLPGGTVGAAYAQTLTASGGTGGYSWIVTAGSLPASLSLSAAGSIIGTPSAPGTSNFTVQVTDSSGTQASKALSIVIAPASLTITTSSLASGTVGAAYAQTLAASGGTGGYSWIVTAGALPASLSLSAGGIITGTPSAAGTSNFTVQVTDSSGTQASKALSIVIAPASLTITTSSLASGTVGATYAQTLTASGGTGGYSWIVTTGSLPAGLSLSAAGGITGTPSAPGTSSFTVQVTDSSGTQASKALSIAIAPASLTVTTSSLPNGTVGAVYAQTLAASGGTGGYSWIVTTGGLPASLSLSAAGGITGTPSAPGTSSFTVQVTDSSGTQATRALSIVIAPASLTITTSSLPGGTVGAVYAQTLAASGGTGGYSWIVTAGALPASLSLSAAGGITGTPSAPGTSSFTVQVTDSSGTQATKALSIVIAPASLVITTSSLPGGTVGAAYQQTLAASGGTGGYSWIVTAGALPASLSLSAAGSVTGTPSASGTSNFTVQVTDSSGTQATTPLSIAIAPAPLTITTSSLPGGTAGTAYQQTLASSGGTGGYSWIVTAGALPAGLSLSAAGNIAGTPSAPGTSNFTVQVTDSSGTQATKALTIVIAPASLVITSSSLPGGTVGTAYQQTLAASGGTGGYSWIVTAGALPASLSLSAAGSITGTPSAPGTSNFTAQVTDSSGTQATTPLSILIAPASLTITTSSLPGGTVGTAYQQTLAVSGGTGGYSWTVTAGSLPASLSLSAAGSITGTPSAPGTSNFTVQVTDSSGTQATKALTILIAPAPLTITTASLPNGTAGTVYQQTLAASGGTAGYSWTVTAGALPAGLSLNAVGSITGTSLAPGTSNFTAQVTDSSGAQATKALSIAIAPPPLIITTASLPNGTAGTAYQQTLAASGGTGGYSWTVTAGTLPAGLSLNAAGSILGTPSGPGTSNFTVQVTDAASEKAAGSFAITINSPLTVTTAVALATGSAGAPYTQTFTALGGIPPYTWTISGTLPAGLTLAATTGVLSGTPTQVGAFPITVHVTDSAGSQASGNYSLQVVSGLTIATPPILPSATIGAPYSTTLQAAGGSSPYQWTVTAGSLPAGLAFSGTGQITGTATSSGTFIFTAQVTDANSNRATKQCTLAVAGIMSVTSTSLPAGATQAQYAQTLTAAGGTPPYSWSVTAGSLPNGLSLVAPTGTLAGTPTTAGSFTFTVTVTDANSVTAQKQFTLLIDAGLTFTTPTSLPGATAGASYSFMMQASGGQSPYSWNIIQGALPDGLSLNAAAGLIGGTPTTSGTFNFTVQVSDAANLTATRVLSIVVALPDVPAISISGFSGAMQPLQQPPVGIVLANPFPAAITGTVSLSFAPGGPNPQDDPSIQFSTGGRTATFTIPANATQAVFGVPQFAVQTGSVAGTITLSIVSLQTGGSSLPIPNALSQTVQVNPGPPVIGTIVLVHTSQGIQVQITGVTTTRELTQVSVDFQPTSGTTLQTPQVTVPLTAAANAWFQSSSSAPFGGQFSLTLPFTFTGSVSLSSISVVLSNSVGDSAAASANY